MSLEPYRSPPSRQVSQPLPNRRWMIAGAALGLVGMLYQQRLVEHEPWTKIAVTDAVIVIGCVVLTLLMPRIRRLLGTSFVP